MSLGDEDRRQLVARLLYDAGYALRLRRESPSLVEEAARDATVMKRLASDPIFFSTLILGICHTPYQTRFLASHAKRIVLRWPRQSGKTLSLAAYALWHASTHPRTTTLIVVPSQRQSMILNDNVRRLIDELNVEQYELTKTGRITLSHASGTHDDRFWALALATYAAEQNQPHHTPRAVTGQTTPTSPNRI